MIKTASKEELAKISAKLIEPEIRKLMADVSILRVEIAQLRKEVTRQGKLASQNADKMVVLENRTKRLIQEGFNRIADAENQSHE